MKKASSETLPSITAAHSTRKIETSHQAIVAGGLPHSIVSELSLATGLPESQIRSWASCLPTGSTVKVKRTLELEPINLRQINCAF